MNMIRIAPLPLADWPAGLLDKMSALTDGKVRSDSHVYRTLANHSDLAIARIQLSSQVYRRATLNPRNREIAILRATALSNGR